METFQAIVMPSCAPARIGTMVALAPLECLCWEPMPIVSGPYHVLPRFGFNDPPIFSPHYKARYAQ